MYKTTYPIETIINNKKSEENPYSIKKQIDEKERIKKISEQNATFSDETLTKAREFIQGSEGFRKEAYKNKGDVWTIGYGHTKGVKEGDIITKEEAERLYREDFEEHSNALKAVTVPLTENQKIALASFIYNNGVYAFKNSTLLKKLNTGDYKGAGDEFNKWIKDGNGIQQGLINRRKKEKELFEK